MNVIYFFILFTLSMINASTIDDAQAPNTPATFNFGFYLDDRLLPPSEAFDIFFEQQNFHLLPRVTFVRAEQHDGTYLAECQNLMRQLFEHGAFPMYVMLDFWSANLGWSDESREFGALVDIVMILQGIACSVDAGLDEAEGDIQDGDIIIIERVRTEVITEVFYDPFADFIRLFIAAIDGILPIEQ